MMNWVSHGANIGSGSGVGAGAVSTLAGYIARLADCAAVCACTSVPFTTMDASAGPAASSSRSSSSGSTTASRAPALSTTCLNRLPR